MAQIKALSNAEAGHIKSYHLDTLGGPFKAILKNCVTQTIDPITGKEKITYPDPVGLVLAVARSRVLDERRLSGDDLSFIRKALGVKAIRFAEFLDSTPEHYSRCEAGTRALSASAEKQLRLFAFFGSSTNHRHALSLYFVFYNWVHIHKTLRVSPAFAAGLTDRLMSWDELVAVIDQFEATRFVENSN